MSLFYLPSQPRVANVGSQALKAGQWPAPFAYVKVLGRGEGGLHVMPLSISQWGYG